MVRRMWAQIGRTRCQRIQYEGLSELIGAEWHSCIEVMFVCIIICTLFVLLFVLFACLTGPHLRMHMGLSIASHVIATVGGPSQEYCGPSLS
jgi:hypothetical protein